MNDYRTLRQRIATHGPGALSVAELLAVLWGSRASANAVAELGPLYELAGSDLNELTAVQGVGEMRAAQLVAGRNQKLNVQRVLVGNGAMICLMLAPEFPALVATM